MLWHARLTAIVFIFNGLLSSVTIANKYVVSSEIYSEADSLSSEKPGSTERSSAEKPDDSKYFVKSDGADVQLYSAGSAGRFRRPGKTPKNETKSGLFESFGNVLLNFIRNAEDKFAKIFLHPDEYLDRGDLIVSRSKGLSSNSSEPFEIRYEAVRVLKPRFKRRGPKRATKQKDQKLGALEKRNGEDSSLISSRLSMNEGNMKKIKPGSGLSKKKQNQILRNRKFKYKTKKGRKTFRNRKYRQVKSKLLRERRNATFDTSQLHRANVKNFKEQEKRFEGLFSSLTSDYGKQKMSHIMENDEFDFDTLANSKFWKEYPKYFNLNHTSDVRNLISEQNKTFLMFEGLDNKDKKEVMKEYLKYGALVEISKRKKRFFNRRKSKTRSLDKRSQSMFHDFKDMFQDILGGMAPHPLREKRFSRKKGTRRTLSPLKQSENIKGGDEFSDVFQNRPKDKLIMNMLLKTSRDAVEAAEKQKLMLLASQVETKGRSLGYLTESGRNPGSHPAPESPSLGQIDKSKRAKLGKRYTIDNDESQDQGPLVQDKRQYNKRNFMDSLRALYEDVIG